MDYNLDRRRETALVALATVGALTVQTTGATGTEYGNWNHYGITDPLWVGVVQEALFSTSWFLQMAGILEALLVLALCAYHDVPIGRRLLPYGSFTCGLALYHVNIFFTDVSYWFNLFVPVELYDLPEGNAAMYVADEVPTAAFLVGMALLVWSRQRGVRAQALDRARVAVVRASGRGKGAARSVRLAA